MKKIDRLHFYVLITITITSLSVAQDKFEYGLVFSGNKYPDNHEDISFEERTSLNLSPEKRLYLPQKFTLSFELAIWKIQEYGNVLSAQNNNGEEINLVYTHFHDPDTSFLVLSIRDQIAHLRIPLFKEVLRRNKWRQIEVSFDIKDKKISARVDNIFYDEALFDIPIMDSVNLTFGAQPLKWNVPRMAIREIKIFDETSERKLLYHWPLDQSQGSLAVETIQNKTGMVHRGQWLRAFHYFWESRPLFTSTNKVSESAYDSKQNQLFWTTGDSLWQYDLNQAQLTTIAIKEPVEHKDIELLYAPRKERLLSIYRGHGPVTVWDTQGKARTGRQKLWFSGQYYAARKFIDFETGDLYMLGGYGYYTVKKDLQRYDFRKGKWDTLKVTGAEKFCPRSGAVILPAGEQRRYFVTGGLGNSSGKQEAGWKALHDVWLLDLERLTILEIQEEIEFPDNLDIIHGYYDQTAKNFYLLTQDLANAHKYQLFSVSNNFTTVTPVGRALYPASRIYYNAQLNILMATGQNYSKKDGVFWIFLHRINYPPISNQEIAQPELSQRRLVGGKFMLLLFVLIFIIVGIIFLNFLLKRKKLVLPIGKTSGRTHSKIDTAFDHPQIRFFGGFQIMSAEGDKLEESLSPKDKQILVYLLLHSRRGGKVMTERFTTDIWPELDSSRAKNARSSAMNRLRPALEGCTFLKLAHDHRSWWVEISDDVYFDYFVYGQLLQKCQNMSTASVGDFDTFIEIISQGQFLPDVYYDWLIPIKSAITNEVVKCCLEKIKSLNLETQATEVEQLADILLNWDSLNEDALRFKIRSLAILKRYSQMKQVYEVFSADYKSLFGDEFKPRLQDIYQPD